MNVTLRMGNRGLGVAVSFTDKIPSSAIYLVLGTFLSLFASVLGVLLITTTAGAISNIGPTDTNTRYAMEYSDSTNATTINVPVYFPALPTGSKTVQVTDFVTGTSGLGVSFNGGASLTTSGSFTIPAGNFVYDPVSGFWRATINATMTGYGATTSWDKYVNFRLVLSDASGYIAYGGGMFNAAPNGYPLLDKSVANMYSLYMATPCDITVNTAQTIRFYDLDHLHDDNGNFPITVRITNTTTGSVVATRNGGSYAMGDGDTLAINMTFEPGHKYRVDIWDVADSNVIQFNFPYDNIGYVVPVCPVQRWDTTGSSIASPTGIILPTTPSVTFTHRITNGGPDATSQTINAEIFQTVNGGAPTSVSTFSRASGLASGGFFQQTSNITPSSFPPGSEICQYVTWSPRSWDNSGSRTSAQDCVTVTSAPRMSIVGGDAVSGGGVGVAPSCPTTAGGFIGFAGASPGSFGEYALRVSPGTFSNFWSFGRANSTTLNFANTPLGSYASSRCVPNLVSKLINGVTMTNIVGASGNVSANGNYQIGSDYTITATGNMSGQRLVYAPGRTVTISGDLTYSSGPHSSFQVTPSLIIIANRIRIDPGVQRIDGLLIGTSSVSTCTPAAENPQANIAALAGGVTPGACRTAPPLTINGAVYTNQFVPARSSGGTSPADPPAEIIRFRPEVFLGPFERSQSSSILRTDREVELPARN